MRKILTRLRVLVVVLFFISPLANAQVLPCGNIIDDKGVTPITDCADPFLVTTDPASPFTLEIRGEAVEDGGMVTIPDIKVHEIRAVGNPFGNYIIQNLYQHDGNDYRLFEPYDENDNWDTLDTGTYTLVIKDTWIFLNQRESLWERMFAYIIPKAYAETNNFPEYTFTISFTVADEIPAPTGASNVLFLPGLMGSRLYEEGGACNFDDPEEERWVSVFECDQLRLLTDFTGISINDIYTRPGNDAIVDEVFMQNIYETFLDALDDWVEDDIINDFVAVPYDWRLQLYDIIKSLHDPETNRITGGRASSVADGYLYQTLTALASSSKSGKVTIVAHSNGGLLAKYFLSALAGENDPLADKIDNLILVSVPQLGTPQAVVGLLHGQGVGFGGFVVSQSIGRRLVNTMPIGHHLLPMTGYFNSVTTPVITFSPGEITTPWINTFGSTITDRATLYSFLRKESGRAVPDVSDLSTPAVVDGFLLQYASLVDTFIGQWTPPAGMKVYQIAGTGLLTPSGLEYFTDFKCINRNLLFKCTAYEPKLGYRARMVVDGDETVVVPSALAMSEGERWWLDLEDYNDDNAPDRKHPSILEVQDLINFISSTLRSTTTNYRYLHPNPVNFPDQPRLTFQLHSPLDMKLVTEGGEEVSSSTNTIAGATYRRFGELQYISLPSTSDNKTLILQGVDDGSFTLDLEEKNGDTLVTRHTYSAIPSASTTRVSVDISDSASLATALVEVDFDGNGTTDVVYNTTGAVENEEDNEDEDEEVGDETTYSGLLTAIEKLKLKPAQKAPFLTVAKAAEHYHSLASAQPAYRILEKLSLTLLKQQFILAEKLRIVTKSDRQSIEIIINELLNN